MGGLIVLAATMIQIGLLRAKVARLLEPCHHVVMWGMRSWLALLGGTLIVIGAGWWFLLRDEQLPAIAADVPYVSIDGNLVFSARVTQHFPVGMKIAELRSELKQDGFTFDEAIVPGLDGSARLVRTSLFCKKTWYIAWRKNAEDRVREIAGKFNRRCMWD